MQAISFKSGENLPQLRRTGKEEDQRLRDLRGRVFRACAHFRIDATRTIICAAFSDCASIYAARIPLRCPAPPEQQRIATCLTSLDALITLETQKLEALKTHKKGLMQQLFPSPEAVEA